MTNSTLPERADFVAGKVLIMTLIAASIVLAAGLAQTSAGTFLLRKAGLSAVPASYTSLAFTDPRSLPARLEHARGPVQTSFAISNTSAGTRSYHWSITLDHAGRTDRLTSGEISVPAGGRVTVTKTVTVSCRTGQARITVRLADPGESIDFLAACSP